MLHTKQFKCIYDRTGEDNHTGQANSYKGKEKDTIAKPFDMTALNHLGHFHLVMDTMDRLPQIGDQGFI